MNKFYTSLIEDLQTKVVFINYLQHASAAELTRKPFTCHPETAGVIEPSDHPDYINVYDIMLQKQVRLKLDLIATFNTHYHDDEQTHLKHAKFFLDKYRHDLSKAETTDVTDDVKQDIYFTYGDCVFHLCRFLDFQIPPNDINENNLSDEQMSVARDCWMNIIRKYRNKQLVELDEVELQIKESGDVEEMEDIDMIKQMFRDIPQEADLTQYKTLKDLIGYWPPLLLPLPEDL